MINLAIKLRQKFFDKSANLYAPFLGAGIKLDEMSSDYRKASISMDLTFYNKNYMGTHFGGSLYSMVDPWYMLMLIKNLGDRFIVWDKAATIHFRRPGTGKVFANFILTDEHLNEIRATLATQTKMDYIFKVEIKDQQGRLIAEVDKTLYIRNKI